MKDHERISYYISAGYTHLLVYTAVHTSASLRGHVREDILPFCDEKSAKSWVTTVNAKEARKAGSVGYRVTLSYVRAL